MTLALGLVLALAAIRDSYFAIRSVRRTIALFSMKWLAVSTFQAWVVPALGLMIAALCVVSIKRKPPPGIRGASGSLGALIPVCLFLYYATPDATAGGSFISARLSLLAIFPFLFWLASRTIPLRLVRGSHVLCAVVFLCLLASNIRSFIRDNRLIAEYVSVSPHIGRDATLLAHCPSGYSTVDPLAHADGYIGAEQRAIILKNYQVGVRSFPFVRRPNAPQEPEFVLIWDRGKLSSEEDPARLGLRSSNRLVFAAQKDLGIRLYRLIGPTPASVQPPTQ
jgi:hypothetical protein